LILIFKENIKKITLTKMPNLPCGFSFIGEADNCRSPMFRIVKLHRKRCEICREQINMKHLKPNTKEEKRNLNKLVKDLERHKPNSRSKDAYIKKLRLQNEYNADILSQDKAKTDKLALNVMDNYSLGRAQEAIVGANNSNHAETLKNRVMPMLELKEMIKRDKGIKFIEAEDKEFIVNMMCKLRESDSDNEQIE
tara:strand:- start:7 stop:591 length:585 start_codon:yes stop_codon:yes gene_type:complete